MSVLQYVGARYVPKLFDDGRGGMEWKAQTYYEPFTLVTSNGGNYISRTPVPATVGEPSANGTYWAFMGAFNATLQSVQEQLSDFMQSFRGKKCRRFVIIGDSYAQGWTPDGTYTSWAQLLSNTIKSMGGRAEVHAAGGAGWASVGQGNATFSSMLASVSEKETVTDVIVAGGYNDYGKSFSAVTIEQSFALFPNAECRYFPIGNTYKDSGKRLAGVTAIRQLGYSLGGLTDVEAFTVLHRHSLFASDGIHPLANGQADCAAYIWGKINGIKATAPFYIPLSFEDFPSIEYTAAGDTYQLNVPSFRVPDSITGMTAIYTKPLSEIECMFPTNNKHSTFFHMTVKGSEGYRVVPMVMSVTSSNTLTITPLLVTSSSFETISGINSSYITGGCTMNLDKYYF